MYKIDLRIFETVSMLLINAYGKYIICKYIKYIKILVLKIVKDTSFIELLKFCNYKAINDITIVYTDFIIEQEKATLNHTRLI